MLLVKHASAHYWGFPKGHPNDNEEPQQAAERELVEETGLFVVQYLSSEISTHYKFKNRGQLIDKTVTYFAAVVSGEVTLQAIEVSDHRWLPFTDVVSALTYDTDRKALQEALSLISL